MTRVLIVVVLVACGSTPPAQLTPPPPPMRPAVAEPPVPKQPPAVLAYLESTLATLARKYFDPARFDYRRMLAGALDAMELEVAEVITEIANDRVTVRVGEQQRTFAGDVDSLSELGIRLTEILHFVQEHAQTDHEKIELETVNGMLHTLDPHTHLISAEELREWEVGMGGKFAGIGITLDLRPGPAGAETVTAITIMPNTPAERAGMKAGDAIVAIDGQATDGFTIEEASNRLRGEPATIVKLALARSGKRLELQITRAEITIPIVESKLLDGNVGYLFIERFGAETVNELERAIAMLRKRGARAWVIDLRQNTGGYLAQAVGAADLFVERGTIVATVAGGKKHDIKEAKPGGDTRSPLVVLVASPTASSSEILAGALKQLDRAVLVGQRTFGKGSVQVLQEAARGGKLKITTAEYISANDVSVQTAGIGPDVELVPAVIPKQIGETGRLRLVPEPPFREVDLGAHVTTAQVLDRDKPAATLPYAVVEQDYEIEFARKLALASKSSRKATLRTLPRFVARARREADAAIVAAFAPLGVDWQRGPGGAQLAVKLDAAIAATAGELVTFTAEVTNTGARPAYRTHARATSDDAMLDGLEIALGKIAPGATARATAIVRLPKGSASRTSTVRWQVNDVAATTKVDIAGVPAPAFAFTAQVIDDNDGIVQRDEPLRIRVRVTNHGPGRAAKPVAIVKSLVADRVAIDRGRVQLGPLEPNQSKDAELVVIAKPSELAKPTVELSITDPNGYASHKLELPIGARPPAVDYTPPRIRVDDVPLETTSDSIRVVGVADDDTLVGDVYITSSNRAVKPDIPRKVFYLAGHKPRLEFRAEVPLAHGANRIVVTAREHASSQTVRTIWVYRR